ncbi:MAG: hypothetical protein KGZ25_15570, partial [Planctomycetes bacterium]|nr:hypothetical protein [Planctomycetota bacterium]
KRDTHEAIFSKYSDGKFQHQALDLNPDHILTPDGWKTAGEGVVSGNLFQVVSFCLVWSAEPRIGLLRSAELHNHICPGVNAGYALAQYIKKRLPLRDGEKYVLVSAPPACPVDGLQTALDCTAGKKAMFTMKTSQKVLAQHEYKKLKPSVIVLRINSAADSCEGSVLAFDFEKACKDLGVSRSNLSPPGGHDNPLFYISRIRIARKMAGMKTEQKMGWIKVLKTFSGNAQLADKLAGASFDPYADLP